MSSKPVYKFAVCAFVCMISVLWFNLRPQTVAQTALDQRKDIYHEGWIDLNKNGRKDIYEDSKADINRRVEDLLRQMTLDEKTCQTATLY